MQESAVPILVVQEGQLAGKRWPLNKTEFVIGRGEDCDIVLPDRQVSRHHFRVVRDDDGYNVEDLGSKNGTYINGAPVRGSMQLQDGDEIQVALSVRLMFVGAEATLPLTQEMLRVAQPGLRLNKSQRQVWVNGVALDPPLVAVAISPAGDSVGTQGQDRHARGSHCGGVAGIGRGRHYRAGDRCAGAPSARSAGGSRFRSRVSGDGARTRVQAG